MKVTRTVGILFYMLLVAGCANTTNPQGQRTLRSGEYAIRMVTTTQTLTAHGRITGEHRWRFFADDSVGGDDEFHLLASTWVRADTTIHDHLHPLRRDVAADRSRWYIRWWVGDTPWILYVVISEDGGLNPPEKCVVIYRDWDVARFSTQECEIWRPR